MKDDTVVLLKAIGYILVIVLSLAFPIGMAWITIHFALKYW